MIFRFTINFGYWRHIYLDLISQFKVTNLKHSKLLLKILRGDQIGLFKLVTLNCILNRITGVTFGC
jgi:hypothetical protein